MKPTIEHQNANLSSAFETNIHSTNIYVYPKFHHGWFSGNKTTELQSL